MLVLLTKLLTTLIVLLIILIFVSSRYDIPEISSGPDNSRVEAALKNEFDLIPIMPNAIEKNRDFIKKSTLMGIGASYITNQSYKEIIDYYDAQLKKHSWEFYREEKITDWGKDYGGKSVEYKKGDFLATVQYAGEKADYGWTYGFDMSWRLHNE